MNITIQIQAPELVKAIESLAAALGGMGTEAPVAATVAEIMVEKEEAPVKEAKQEAPAEKADEPVETSADEKAEEKKPETPSISLETVRGKLAALSQSGKQKEVKELISSFGAKKLTDVPAEKYAELLAAAEKIA